jgi:hypothetical protein
MPEQSTPRLVFLFSGHMIDRPDRPEPRFPPEKVDAAAAAIASQLEALRACDRDVAFCSAACGGDLLFARACLDRGVSLRIRLPFPEPEFLNQSVRFAGDRWVHEYFAVTKHHNSQVSVMPDALGPTPEGVDPFARNNLWLMDDALASGAGELHFICLWDGHAGDGPGGTQHMYDTVVQHAGQVHVIDPRKL